MQGVGAVGLWPTTACVAGAATCAASWHEGLRPTTACVAKGASLFGLVVQWASSLWVCPHAAALVGAPAARVARRVTSTPSAGEHVRDNPRRAACALCARTPSSVRKVVPVDRALSSRRLLAVLALLIAIGIALPRFLTHTPYPRLGCRISRDHGVVERVVGPPALGLLRPGDRVIATGSMDLSQQAERDTMRAHGWPRGPFPLTIERDGRQLTIVIPPVQLSGWQRLRLYTYPIAAVIAAPLVAFLLVWRRPDLSSAWAFLWFAALQGLTIIYSLYQFPQQEFGPGFHVYLKVLEWLSWLYPASFVHFMSVFPRSRWQKGSRVRSPWLWVTLAAYVAPQVIWIVKRGWDHTPPDSIYNWYQAIAILIGISSLFERYSRTGPDWHPTTSQRALALVAAFALLAGGWVSLIANDPRIQALTPEMSLRFLFSSISFAWLSTPFIIAYLIADDPVFDPRRLIVGGLPYALLSGVLAAIYLAIVLGGQRMFASATGEQALAFNLVAALIVAFTFAPLRERVQRMLAGLFGRDPEALRRALDAAGRDLLSALDRDEVRAAVEGGITRGLRRPLAVAWVPHGPPQIADPGSVPDDARGPIESLLAQAGVRLDNLQLAAQRAADERNAVELRALQAQVQPHFLFNALNALAYLIESDPMAASRFTGRLADMLRYTVEAGKRPAALLSDELAFVEDYLGVARERYENPLHFKYKVDPTLMSLAVPPLMLQPLVENSLKHGIAPGSASLRMTFEARVKDGWLELEFADDGNPNGNGGPGLGVGLENLEQRLRRFAGPEARMAAGPREAGTGDTGMGFVVRLSWLANTGGER